MKKLVIYPLMLCLLVFSCKKEEAVKAVETSGKKYAVKFTASGLAQTFEKLNVKGSGVPKSIAAAPGDVGSIRVIFYMLYNSHGEEIHRFRQAPNSHTDKYTPNGDDQLFNWPFGTITDTLLAGNYTLITLAGPGPYGINWYSEGEEFTHFINLDRAFFEYTGGLDNWSRATDTFYGKLVFTVGNEAKEEELELNRIVGQVVIRLTDQIPANARYFRFLYLREFTGLQFDDLSSAGDALDEDFAPSIPITDADRAKPGYEHPMFICNTIEPIDVVINCYDSSNRLIAVRLIPNVQVHKNKRTILTGSLFSPTPPTAFTVDVDDQWDPEEEKVDF